MSEDLKILKSVLKIAKAMRRHERDIERIMNVIETIIKRQDKFEKEKAQITFDDFELSPSLLTASEHNTLTQKIKESVEKTIAEQNKETKKNRVDLPIVLLDNDAGCPYCESKNTTRHEEMDCFDYGVGEDCYVISMEAEVIVHGCIDCGKQWTDYTAEDARAEAIINTLYKKFKEQQEYLKDSIVSSVEDYENIRNKMRRETIEDIIKHHHTNIINNNGGKLTLEDVSWLVWRE